MQKKVWEIISMLIQYLIEEGEIGSEKMWKMSLNLQGYLSEDIDTAIAWLRSVMIDKDAIVMNNSVRVFAPFEKTRLSKEAQDFLLRLKEMGFIDSKLQEEIIERALILDVPQIRKEEIKIVSAILLSISSKKGWHEKALKIIEENLSGISH